MTTTTVSRAGQMQAHTRNSGWRHTLYVKSGWTWGATIWVGSMILLEFVLKVAHP